MPITEYKCSLCRRTFKTYSEAETCEKSHLNVEAIIDIKYGYSPYPVSLEVLFKDSEKRIYYIDGFYS